VRDRTTSALHASWNPLAAGARAAPAHRGEPEQAQAALQAGLQARRRNAVRAVGDVRRRGRLASRGQQLGVHIAGLCGHEQHRALDRGHDADAAAQHLRSRMRGFVPEANPSPIRTWWTRTAWRTGSWTRCRRCRAAPARARARICPRMRSPATNSMALDRGDSADTAAQHPARASGFCPGGNTLHETAWDDAAAGGPARYADTHTPHGQT